MVPGPTLEQVERQMRAVLKNPRTRVVVITSRTLDGYANWRGTGDDGHIVIALEPFNGGMLATLVHELGHYVLRKEAKRWGQMEEAFILGLDKEMSERIRASKRRWNWWRKALEAKLRGSV